MSDAMSVGTPMGMTNGTHTQGDSMDSRMPQGIAEVNGQSKVDRYRWRTDTKPGELRYVPKLALRVDERYQRNATEGKVLALARDWSWPAVGVLIVARRSDGTFWVIDGQHRLLASLRRSDVQDLPCIIFSMDDVAVEARAFDDANNRRKGMTSVDKYRARLVAGDPLAAKVAELLAMSGRTASNGDGPTLIRCVGTLATSLENNEAVTRRIWPIVVELSIGRPISERLISGLVYLESHLAGEETLCAKRWRDRLNSVGAATLVNEAAKAAAFYSHGGAKIWARGMLEAVNHGLRYKLSMRSSEDTSRA